MCNYFLSYSFQPYLDSLYIQNGCIAENHKRTGSQVCKVLRHNFEILKEGILCSNMFWAWFFLMVWKKVKIVLYFSWVSEANMTCGYRYMNIRFYCTSFTWLGVVPLKENLHVSKNFKVVKALKVSQPFLQSPYDMEKICRVNFQQPVLLSLHDYISDSQWVVL